MPIWVLRFLHKLQEDKLLKQHSVLVDGKIRKYYRTTAKGTKVLSEIKGKIQELTEEIISDWERPERTEKMGR